MMRWRLRAWRFGRTGAWMIAAVIVLGCQSPRDSSPRDPQHIAEAAATLQKRADEELGRSAAPVRDVPLPPGLDSGRLETRPSDDPRARLTPREAVDFVLSRTMTPQQPSRRTARELSIDERIAAQHHYARGRQAALERRHFVANQEFRRAYEIDPTDPLLVRQLARSYAAIRNNPRAIAHYEELRVLLPDDQEAAFVLGLNAAREGRPERAIFHLGLARVAGGTFRHDPGADILADYTLAMAFRQLGFDQAEIEMSKRAAMSAAQFNSPSGYATEIESIRRRSGDLALGRGDAYMRLGDSRRAAVEYLQAEHDGAPTAALLPRQLLLYLRSGRPVNAQLAFFNAASRVQNLDEWWVQLAGYMNDVSGSTELLADAITASLDSDARAAAVRMRAALLPDDRGIEVLSQFVAENPGDRKSAGQLIDWYGSEDSGRSVQLVLSVVRERPGLASTFADLLFEHVGLAPDAIDVLDERGGREAAYVAARLFLRAGGLGEAWRRVERAIDDHPNWRALHLLRIEVAAALRDAEAVHRAVSDLGPLVSEDDFTQVAQAHRVVGNGDLAVSVAREGAGLFPDDVDLLTEFARTLTIEGDTIAEAIDVARRALTIDPGHEEALELLIRVFSEGGPVPDEERLRALWEDVNRYAPSGRLRSLIVADQLLASRQYQQVITDLLPVYQAHPADDEVLLRMVNAWVSAGDAQQADQWLRQQLEQRPYSAALLRERVRVLGLREQLGEAERLLRARLDDWAPDAPAALALELVLRAQNRTEEAARLAEDRLLTHPPGTRRSVELAIVYLQQSRVEDALREIIPVVERFDTLSADLARRAMTVADQLPLGVDGIERIRSDMIEQFVRRFPDAPMQLYGAGLLSLARQERARAFEFLLNKMITDATGGSAPGLESIATYRDLAQALINEDRAVFAGQVAFARLQSGYPISNEGKGMLAQVAQACFAVADDLVDARAVIDWLADANELWLLPMPADTPDRLAEALYSLSVFCTLIDRDDAAQTLLLDALSHAPDHAMALNNLGYRRLELNRGDDATVRFVERAFELEGENANVLDTMAWLRYKQRQFTTDDTAAGAIELIERAIEQLEREGESLNPELLDHYGDILWRLDQRGRAIESWAEALRMAESDAYRQETTRNYLRYQQLGWGIVAVDPEQIFARIHEPILVGTRAKLESARTGAAPKLAPTFAEGQLSGR